MDRLGGDFGAFGGSSDTGGYDDDAADDGLSPDVGAHSNPPPSPVGQDDRRMQVRAYNHWASQLGDQELPHIEDLEPEFLGDFGPHSVLLDFSTGSSTPTIQFIGAKLRKECGLAEPIESVSEIPEGSVLSQVAGHYLKVLAAQAPISFQAESINLSGRTIAFRGVMLPYSSDYDTIDFVFAVINWKELADAQTADAILSEIDAAMAQQSPAAASEPQTECKTAPMAEIVHFPRMPSMPVEAARDDGPAEADEPHQRDDTVLAWREAEAAAEPAHDDLPMPTFGQAEETYEMTDPIEPAAAADGPDDNAMPQTPSLPRREQAVDALGNPVGGQASQDDDGDAPTAGGITSASDYGLPEWDEEEPEDDVDDLVNPLADIDLNSRLLALVNSGTRGKKTVDLATLSDTPRAEEATDERELFRPKAPSIDSVLSVEDYDDEEEGENELAEIEDEIAEVVETAESEDEVADIVADTSNTATDAEEHDYAVHAELEQAPEVAQEFADEHGEEVAAIETDGEPEPVDAPADLAAFVAARYGSVAEPAPVEPQEYTVAAVAEEASDAVLDAQEAESESETYEDAFVEAEIEVECDDPFELNESFIVDEANAEAAPEHSAWDSGENAVVPYEQVAEIAAETDQIEADTPETGEDADETEIQALVAYAAQFEQPAATSVEDCLELEIEAADDDRPVPAEGAGTDDHFHGLLAAVHQLSEAARATQDPERRALYEAVSKAFDVSIKAVLATEQHTAGPAPSEPVDVDDQFEKLKDSVLRRSA